MADFPEPAPLTSHGPARVISLCNQKGGVGKTTTTISLAGALVEYGRKVLVVDFDPQGALTAGLGATAHDVPTIYDLLVSSQYSVRDAIQATKVDNLHIIPANIDLSAAEVQLVNEVARESILLNVLRPIMNEYDVILIDCQPSLGLLTVNALTARSSAHADRRSLAAVLRSDLARALGEEVGEEVGEEGGPSWGEHADAAPAVLGDTPSRGAA